MEVIDVVGVGALLVGIVTLVVVVLTLRNTQSVVQLAEARMEYLHEEQERLAVLHEEHKTLNEELVHERQERLSLQEQLNQEQQERLEAQRRAEQAEQEALRGATQQLREQMDRYIQELEEAPRQAPPETANGAEEDDVAESSDVAEGSAVTASAPGQEERLKRVRHLRRISQRRSPNGWRGG
jgi:membrane protein involved in colicin uptake